MRCADMSVMGAGAGTWGAPVSGVTSSSRAAALLPLIAHQDLILQVVPDLAVDLAELRLHANLGHVARPRQRHRIVRLHGPWSGADDEDAIGQRDGLLEVVGDEDNRRTGGSPQRKELVFHQRSRLHVEGAEGLVHQQDLWLVDQALRERDALPHPTRQLIRIAVLEAGEPDTRDPFATPFASLASGLAVVARPGRGVVEQ